MRTTALVTPEDFARVTPVPGPCELVKREVVPASPGGIRHSKAPGQAYKRIPVFAGVLVLWAAAAFAETQIQPGTTVITTSAAPVFLMPDPTRIPLRTLPSGTTATADRVQDGWVRITFNDPQYGPRTGWVELKLIKVVAAPTLPAPRRPEQTPVTPGGARPPTTTAQPRTVQPRRQPPSLRVFAGAGLDRVAAAESFKAVTGSDRFAAFGGGVQAADVWQHLFVEFAVEYSRTDGERVFVFNNEVFSLGIPVEINSLPIDLVGGWRFPLGRVTPFAGGGVTFLRYEEKSDFAEDEENVLEWNNGFIGLAGVEVRLTPNLHVRGEFRYRRLTDALGAGGVSAVFGDSQLGGAGGGIKVVFGR